MNYFKKLNFIIIFAYLIILTTISGQTISHNPKDKFSRDGDVYYERMVGKGVKHIYEFIKEKPYQINILEITLNQPEIKIEAEKGKDQLFEGEKVASIAKRENKENNIIIGAVNADFWGTKYITIGFMVDDNTIYKKPHTNRASFFMDESGTPYIDYLTLELELISGDKKFKIDSLNSPEIDSDSILFSSRAYSKTPKDKPRYEIILKQISEKFIPNVDCNVEVLQIKENSSETAIEGGQFILSISAEKSSEFMSLTPGTKLVLKPTIPEFSKPIILAVGGGPRLLKEGNVDINYEFETIGKNFCTDLHPRTALGYNLNQNKMWLMTVDGRQPSISIGMNLYEMADYLKKLGATEAINLDGGGSTTMWVRGDIVNSPSDATGPRTVTNALLVICSAQKGDAAYISIEPENILIPEKSKINFNAFAYDQYYNPVDIKTDGIQWILSSEINANINKKGLLEAKSESAGTLIAKYKEKNISAYTPVKISKIGFIESEPAKVIIESGEEKSVKIKLFSKNKENLLFSKDSFKIKCNADFFDYRFTDDEMQIRGIKKGKDKITFECGDVKYHLPVLVDYLTSQSVIGFEPEDIDKNVYSLTGNYYDTAKTKLSAEKGNKKEGNGSLRLDYSMISGGTTAIYLGINKTLPGEPTKIGLWVYGDGGKAWLRSEISDKDGEIFIMDFTEGGRGILWKDEWKLINIPVEKINPKWTNPRAKLDYPVTINNIYIVQAKEADKGSGSILFDNLTVVVPED